MEVFRRLRKTLRGRKKEWLGFKQALAITGLDADEAIARLKQGRQP